MIERASKTMQDDQKTKAELLQELDGLRKRAFELEQVKEALKHSEKQFKELFENAVVGVYRTTPDGRIITANPALVRMLGFSSFEELSQLNLEKEGFAPGYPRSIFKDLIEKEGKVVGLESGWLRRDGTTLFVTENARVIRDGSGKTLYYEGIVQDITQRKRAEEMLKQYQFMVESAHDVIFFKDLKSRYIIANNKTLEAFGLSREQVIGKNDYEIMPNKDEARKNIEDDNLVFKTGKLTKITKHMTGTDGKERWFQAIKVPQFDEEGKIIGLIGIARDITECKKAEGELRESEERYRTLYETTKDGMAGGPMDGRILECNQAFADMLGYSKAELCNLTYQEITPERWHQMEAKIVEEQILKRGYSDEYEKEYIRKDGTVFPISARVWLRKDKDGKPVGTWGIARNITECKRAEKALRESEHQKRAILDSTPDLAWLKNKEGIYIAANEPLCKAFGVKLEDLVGKTDFDISPEDLAKKYRADDEKVMKSGKRKRVVEPWGKKKGKRIWIETIKTPIYNDSGELIGTSGIARDITERKKTEEELRESEEKYRRLFEETTDAIYVADAETGIITDCNHAAAELVGREKSELIGKHQRFLHPPEEIEGEFSRTFKQHLEEKEGQVLEAQVITKQGKIKDVAIRAGLIELEGKKRIQAMFRDITESKQREKELNLYREKMARAEQLASVGTLSATLAHELTQPLTVIRLSIENALAKLETTPSEATVMKNIEDSLTEVSNITSIVNRFRNYARRSSKRIVGEVNLKAVAERTVQLLSQSARQAWVTLRLEGMDKLPHIYSSEKDIEQLFFALVENAVQAADGEKDRQLIIGGDVKEDRIELRFSDDCGGIAPENLDRIFEPFFTTRPAGEGTGLGLCIVQDVVSRAGGKVRVESQAGQGTTFFITLPINKGKGY